MCVCGGGGGYGLLTEKSINKFVVIESILSRSMQHYNNIVKLQKHITLKKCLIFILRARERSKISIIMSHCS